MLTSPLVLGKIIAENIVQQNNICFELIKTSCWPGKQIELGLEVK